MLLKNILNFFFKLDFFQAALPLYFMGNKKQGSLIGFFLTLLILAFLAYQFINSELFAKSNPNVVNQSLASTHAERIEFNDRQYLFMAVGDVKNRYVEPTIFQIVALYTVNNLTIPKPVHPCQYEDFKEAMSETYFNKIRLNDTYCLDNHTFSLEGYVDEINELRYLTILLFPCSNLTMNGTCATPEKIQEFFFGKGFSVSYPTVQIDAKDYHYPLKINIDPIMASLDVTMIKTSLVLLKKAEVRTDDGWLFADTNIAKHGGLMLDVAQKDVQARTKDSQYLIEWNIFASKQKVLCTRNYQKLPETLASLAGMGNLFIFIGIILTKFVNSLSSMEKIVNSLYYFENLDEKKKNQNQNFNKITETIISKDLKTNIIKQIANDREDLNPKESKKEKSAEDAKKKKDKY